MTAAELRRVQVRDVTPGGQYVIGQNGVTWLSVGVHGGAMETQRLGGRVVIVTGASRRGAIGAAIARRVVADGAAVMVHSWAPHDAEQPWGEDVGGVDVLLDELRREGGQAEHASIDLSDPDGPTRLMNAARETFGHVDAIVVNHARSSSQSLAELTASELDLTFAVNTRAALLLVQAFAAQHDAKLSAGRVLLFTSGQYHGAMPTELPYVASKAALHEVTRTLAVELAPSITINCVNPGPNDTGYADPETMSAVAKANPGQRWGTPDDAARLVSWLLSDEAAWITGQTIASDGGWSSR